MAKTSQRTQASPSTGNSTKKRNPRGHVNGDSKRTYENEPENCFTRRNEATQLFPRSTPLIVAGVTLVIRVLYVLNPRNWWMVHPDEVYQSIEVAHIETFGYGFRTYDFSPPELPSDDTSRYRQMEIQAGMFALRSPLFPFYYVLVSKAASLLGLQGSHYVLWRVAHVVASSFLPLAVHRFAAKLYGSSDKGCVVAILVAVSTHLNVLGTHCLLHSFLAPFTFLALSMLADLSDCHSKLEMVSHDSRSLGAEPCIHETYPLGDLNNNKANSIKASTQKTHKRAKKEYNTTKTKLTSAVDDQCNCRDHRQGTFTDCPNLKQRITKAGCTRPRSTEIITAALIATITCYVRPDVTLIYITHLVVFPKVRKFIVSKNLISLLLGASGGLAIGIAADFCYYGWGVYSCLNWLNFNFISGFSNIIFGEMSWWFYTEKLFLQNYGVAVLLLFVMFAFFVQIIKTRTEETSTKHICDNESTNKTKTTNHRTGIRSSIVWIVLLLVYSFNKHKEARFIHDAVIFMFIFIADVIVDIKLHVQSQTKCNNFIGLMLVVFTLTQYQSFPANSKNLDWIYHRTESVNDVNECIKFISEQTDVTGVFYDSNLYMTGGMSLLHHNVPVLSFIESGFYEFGPQSRRNYSQTSIISTNEEVEQSINEFNRASNYISVANAPAVFRVIIQNTAYNYLIIKQDRKFVDFGFKEVYTVGNSRVLKRLLDVESEYMLERLLDRIPTSSNSTILLHEGDVLFHMNQYLEASERFYRAVTMDQRLLEAYLPLQISYSKLGNEKAARAVHAKCLSLFDTVACTTPRKITRV
ncbi:hypothetical protein BsWGS_07518 [Bradybaena similaris]